jgi:serine/threonine protein kinase
MKTQTGITAGSTRWQSPELIRGLEHDPGECDVYALAMTFYEVRYLLPHIYD